MRAVLTTLLLLAAVPVDAAPTVTKIDVPGARFTYAEAISPSGIVAGSYEPSHFDACGNQCGYVRTPDGTITTFSVFGAWNMGARTILDDGTIAGTYLTGHNQRAFIRTPNGALAYISFRKSDTVVKGMTTSGIVAGSVSSSSRNDVFMRTPDGAVEILKMNGCTFAGTIGINAAGTVAGSCFHKNTLLSYLHTLDGTTTFVKKSGWKNIGISAIDDTGAVAGVYTDKKTDTLHGYIRNASGMFCSFELPGDNPVNTYVIAMTVVSGDRQVVGWLEASDQRNYGFIHHTDGTDEIFDVSGGHETRSGTLVSGISPSGVVVGYYFDDGLLGIHGFIR